MLAWIWRYGEYFATKLSKGESLCIRYLRCLALSSTRPASGTRESYGRVQREKLHSLRAEGTSGPGLHSDIEVRRVSYAGGATQLVVVKLRMYSGLQRSVFTWVFLFNKFFANPFS
jgi:hypothetical protein